MIRRRTSRWGRVFDLLVVLLPLSTPVQGEEKHPDILSGENRALSIRLAEARKLLDEQKWSQAIEALQSILNGNGNDLVPLTPSHSIRAGRLCQVQLAALPAEALRLYRQRYENQARKKLEQAQAERDVAQLRKLVEEDFCTKAAEKAIDLLGDLAFERGRFEEAEDWWRLLAPPQERRVEHPARPQPPLGEARLGYPDPSIDPARSQAKQLLARLFQDSAGSRGDSPTGDSEWKAALDAFRQKHAKAEGTLAGRKGRYADVLEAVAQERKKEGDVERLDWPTFAGDFSRGRSIPASEDILDRLSELCSQGPTWRFSLEQRTRLPDGDASPAVNAAQARLLDFYPVIVGAQVLLADARYVTAFDLRTGQSKQWYDVAKDNGGMSRDKLPMPPDLRYTLTVADGQAFVRLGAQDIGLDSPAPQRPGQARLQGGKETYLACLSLRPDDAGNHFRWSVRGITHENSLFEGAPVAAGGLIWIASTFSRNNRLVSAIDCYNRDDTSQPPLRWRCEVCETSETKAGEPRYRHHLLTLAGTQLVYCTHNGAVVALDALTGRRNWAIRYPRRTLDTEEVALRDLAPVLFAAGRLYVAPTDSDSLLCLDPATGRTLWEGEPLRVVHLLGVGQGRLIFTTSRGLQAVRADNGIPAWSVPDTGRLTPAGRGLLIGDVVLFPTTQQREHVPRSMETTVYAIRQSDGRPADDPARLHRLPAGNLAYGNGCLVVADRQTLSVFVPPRLLLEVRKAEVQRQPDSGNALLQLAQAEADAGLYEDALRTLSRSEPLIQALPESRRKHLLGRLHSVRQLVLLNIGRRAADAERWEDAASALRDAINLPLPPRRCLNALLITAQIWEKAKQTNRALAVWQTIAADETLRAIPVIDRNGKPTSAAQSAASSLERLGQPVAVGDEPRGTDLAQIAGVQNPPLFRSWHTRLESNEWVLTAEQPSDPELLLTGSAEGWIRCRHSSTGEVSWTRRLPFTPCWSGCHANKILAAGEKGIACLGRDNGAVLWHFPAPEAGRSARSSLDQVRVVLDPQPPEPLTAFQLKAGRLFMLQGQRRLFALDAETGTVLWDCWAPDGQLQLPTQPGLFSPCYHAGTETILTQMSGRRWLLDARIGKQIHQAACGRDSWQRTPLALDEHSLCLVLDNRSVELLDARTGQSRWTHQLTGATLRSGEMPMVLGKGNLLLCVQPTNVGYFLHRLDPQSGHPVWLRPRLLKAKSVDVRAWTFDAETLYSIEEDLLIARSLAGGETLWQRPLPVAGISSTAQATWQARRVGDSLVVSPLAFGPETRFRFRSPLGAVQWNLGSLLAPEAIYPLSYLDPKTGQLVQRLHFRIESPVRTTVEKGFDSAEGNSMWTLRTSSVSASERGPVIRLDSPQPIVAMGGEVWGLTKVVVFRDAERR